jgi:hypothetical protein
MKSGRILIMRAARPLTQEEQRDLLRREAFPEWEYVPHTEGAPFEYKASDWGWLGNRLVALDYSSHALFSNEEKQALFEEALRRKEAEDKSSRPEL